MGLNSETQSKVTGSTAIPKLLNSDQSDFNLKPKGFKYDSNYLAPTYDSNYSILITSDRYYEPITADYCELKGANYWEPMGADY